MEFRAVTLQEPGTGRNLLENVTFAVPAGSQRRHRRLRIRSRRRSLVYLIPRFLDPDLRRDPDRGQEHPLGHARIAAGAGGAGDAGRPGCSPTRWRTTSAAATRSTTCRRSSRPRNSPTPTSSSRSCPTATRPRIGGHGQTLKPGERFRLALARALSPRSEHPDHRGADRPGRRRHAGSTRRHHGAGLARAARSSSWPAGSRRCATWIASSC